ncbi:MAG: hypothetical protein AAF936_03830 [Pseudomonadota bacterium]
MDSLCHQARFFPYKILKGWRAGRGAPTKKMQDAVFIVFTITVVAFVVLNINFALVARRREREPFIQTAVQSGPSTTNPFVPNSGAVIDAEFEPVDPTRRRPSSSSQDTARNTHNRARSKQCHRTIIAQKAWAKSLNVLRDAG